MKNRTNRLIFIGSISLAGGFQATAGNPQFFRVAGPTAVSIVALNGDGTLVWSNATPGSVYTVQAAVSLIGSNIWADYTRLVASNITCSNVIISPTAPAGMTFIPGGAFTMGDNLDGESDAVPLGVTVSGFYMDINLVSFDLWNGVRTYATNHGYTFDHPGAGKGGSYPVETVSWYDCAKWCNARSEQAGLTPVYYLDSDFIELFTQGTGMVYADWTADGFRLPTEAEWEKAARGGLNGERFPWGNTITQYQANYNANPNPPNASGYTYDLGPYSGQNTNFDMNTTLPYANPVGFFPPNGYGLHDMAGNVFEWCWDYYTSPYGKPTTNNPTGPTSSAFKVYRGGSFAASPPFERCAARADNTPTTAINALGFRCAKNY